MESEKKNGPDAAELLRVREFCRTLEEAAANLPDDVRAALYRPCAEACVKGSVLEELRRQFLECGGDLDRQYARYGRSAYFFADVVERPWGMPYPSWLAWPIEPMGGTG